MQVSEQAGVNRGHVTLPTEVLSQCETSHYSRLDNVSSSVPVLCMQSDRYSNVCSLHETCALRLTILPITQQSWIDRHAPTVFCSILLTSVLNTGLLLYPTGFCTEHRTSAASYWLLYWTQDFCCILQASVLNTGLQLHPTGFCTEHNTSAASYWLLYWTQYFSCILLASVLNTILLLHPIGFCTEHNT
jgi:hypothetical protein